MDRFMRHFAHGTQRTVTGAKVGVEVETIFVFADTGQPITQAISARMRRALATGAPAKVAYVGIDLSRATHELAIGPCSNFDELMERTSAGLHWLYAVARNFGATPHFAPSVPNAGPLVDTTTDPRDNLWVQLDGREALEQLTCASVQFTVDTNPADAVSLINELWVRQVHEQDFADNDRRWRNYIATSRAGYHPQRYGGPPGFATGPGDLAGYVEALCLHDVVMHHGRPSRLDPLAVADLDINLFLRSVWWHYRLRRYHNSLCLEIRPFSRRDDTRIETCWRSISPIFGL